MRVLLVEDEERLARAVKRVLEHERFQVETAQDGAAAVSFAQSSPFDLMILDVRLPIMDGFQVCRVLREAGNQLPILMLTALGEVHDRVKGLDTGADDYLVKPFSFEELLARMRALLRRRTDVLRDAVLRAGDLELDMVRHEARRGGKTMDLTSTEFRLLEFLMRNQGQVFSRARILESVWGYVPEVEFNVVDTYIHYLREKIDKDQATRLIHTVRGVGYVLKAE